MFELDRTIFKNQKFDVIKNHWSLPPLNSYYGNVQFEIEIE